METAGGADAHSALGFGGHRVEAVPARHLLIVVSTDVNLTNPSAPTASPDDTQRLVNLLVLLAR
jgi:hypothetical protein